MAIHPQAGQLAPNESLVNIPKLISAYYTLHPDAQFDAEKVSFGTSGHRGSAFTKSFNEAHILVICQAICEYRQLHGIEGPLYLGKDTHALSEAAFTSALQVLVANDVTVRVQKDDGYTPTPVISHAILTHNRDVSARSERTDGIVITPSHNPPEDGGIKYNPPKGGPADKDITDWIAERANELMWHDMKGVKQVEVDEALSSDLVESFDYIEHYVSDLDNVIDMAAIKKANVRIGVDPLGGSGIAFWEPIAERYGLNIDVVNDRVDPAFSFMPLDKDGRIRMDCSSPYAMANLLKIQDQFDVAVGNDPDYDRHGIVCPGYGLMNPNAYLAVAIEYLATHRDWPVDIQYGKTLVSSAMIDRVVTDLGKTLCEVPVGFKWYVDGLFDGNLAFGGEESAGASFLRRDGNVWTTDKDGFIMALLAAEILAVTGKNPAQLAEEQAKWFGQPYYKRIDVIATPEQKAVLSKLEASSVHAQSLAGDPIVSKLTHAPGNGAAIGGLKVSTENGWFAARPSGTEDVYKIYLESFVSESHLAQLEQEAVELVNTVLG